jgi:hypothetical protein
MLSNIKNLADKELTQPSIQLSDEEAAIVLQKHFRGRQARKKYKLNQIPSREQALYRAFVVGNGPVIVGLDKFKSKEKIALVALSGMRSISIACELGDSQHIPKIFLIDNSWQVIQLWKKIQAFATQHDNAKTFIHDLKKFMRDNEGLCRGMKGFENLNLPGVKYLDQNVQKYFEQLFSIYGFDYVKAIVLHTSIIAQSWADPDVFNKVTNILSELDIKDVYVYASDIVMLVDDVEDRNQILSNIESLNPVLSIHHDCCEFHNIPEKVYLLTNQNPDYVKEVVMYQDSNPFWLHIASQNGYLDLVKNLVEENEKDLNQSRDDGSTPLFLAAQYNHLDIAEFLLRKGANPNQTRDDGYTPLLIAALNKHDEMIALLLTHGANFNKAIKFAQRMENTECALTLSNIKYNQLLLELNLTTTPRERAIETMMNIKKYAKSPAIFIQSLDIFTRLDKLADKLGSTYKEAIDKAYLEFIKNPYYETGVELLKHEYKMKCNNKLKKTGFSFSIFNYIGFTSQANATEKASTTMRLTNSKDY